MASQSHMGKHRHLLQVLAPMSPSSDHTSCSPLPQHKALYPALFFFLSHLSLSTILCTYFIYVCCLVCLLHESTSCIRIGLFVLLTDILQALEPSKHRVGIPKYFSGVKVRKRSHISSVSIQLLPK